MRLFLRWVLSAGFLTAVLYGCGKPAPDVPEKPEEKTVHVASVSVSPMSLELVVGQTATLTATVLPADAADSSVSWSTSDEGIASVSQSGEVKAVAVGKATIAVTTKDGWKTASCSVTVTPARINVASVSVDPASLFVEKGQTAQLIATVSPADASDPSVVWSSSDEAVATVSRDGLVTALELGQAVITVSSVDDGTKKAQCALEIVKPSNVIWYKSNNDVLVEPYAFGGIGRPVSNSFVDGWGELVFGASIQFLGEKVFYNCSALTDVILPAKVGSIGDSAFSGCTSLIGVTLPDGLESLGESVFYGCRSLTRIALPASLKSIGEGAFSRCAQLAAFESPLASSDGRCLVVDGALVAFAPAGLADYALPEGTKTVASVAMKYCTQLQSVTIPASVESIGEYAFYNCSSLKRATFKGTTPPVLGNDAFLDVDRSFRIYVPASALADYKKAEGWKPYVSIIVAAD